VKCIDLFHQNFEKCYQEKLEEIDA